MARVSCIQTNCNGGEISPLLLGRPDMHKYGVSLKTGLNYLPLVQGAGKKRGGFRYLGATKENGKALFVPFVRSRAVAYMLEFGERYIRFWTRRGQAVVAEGGEPYEIESPYAADNLFDASGASRLDYAASGDVMYLACPDMAPRKLSFRGVNDWTLEECLPKGGPWAEPNADKTVTVTVNGDRAGNVTLTASAGIFSPGRVGGLMRLELQDLSLVSPWAADIRHPPDYCRSDGGTYRKIAVRNDSLPYSGNVPPTHTRGEEWDDFGGERWIDSDLDNMRRPGVLWQYRDSGYGIVRITGCASATSATGRVVPGYELPDHLIGRSTWLWQFGAWSGAGTYPSCCAFFRERLVFAGGTRVWMSKAADFENFEDKTHGQTTTDNAVTVMVVTEQGVDTIAALASMEALIVITGGGEIAVSEATTAEPLGPENVRVRPQSAYGGRALKPVKVGGAGLFVQSGGRKVRELSYDGLEATTSAPDMTVLAEHITGPGIIAAAYQQEPYSIVWYVRADGVLLGFTRDARQEVMGWHRHVLGGGLRVEGAGCIPSHDSPDDEMYIIARVETDEGEIRRFVCCLDPGHQSGGALEDAFFVDCGKTVESPVPVTEIPGLEHLEGMTVDVLLDGGTHETRVVADGRITLQHPAKKIQVGLGYEFVMETMPIEAGAQAGTAQGARKLLRKPLLRVFESAGGEVGVPAENRWQAIFPRDVRDAMDRPVGLVTGDIDAPWPGGWNTAGSFGVRQRMPFPLCVLALMFVVETVDL